MTDKQEPDIVERLRKYPADPTMCDDYSAAMLDAADEIERLRAAQPAQPAEPVEPVAQEWVTRNPAPNAAAPIVPTESRTFTFNRPSAPAAVPLTSDALKERPEFADCKAAQPAPAPESLRDTIGQALSDYMGENSNSGLFSVDPFNSFEIDAIADAVVSVLPAQPAPAQEPQRPSDERIRELVIDYGVESLRLGSEEARYSAGVGGSNYRASFLRAKRAEALKRVERAIEATIVPPGYVVLEIESVREIITDIEQHIGQGKESEKKEAAERPGYGTGTYTHLWRKMQKLRAMTRAER